LLGDAQQSCNLCLETAQLVCGRPVARHLLLVDVQPLDCLLVSAAGLVAPLPLRHGEIQEVKPIALLVKR
jgi:hypothetical protein